MKERTPILKGTYNVEVKLERTKMEGLGMTIDKKAMQKVLVLDGHISNRNNLSAWQGGHWI